MPKGEPENPLTLDETVEKFAALATYAGKNEEEISEIVEAVLNIEDNLDILCQLI